MQARSLGWEDPLEMATCFSILGNIGAWKILWTEDPAGYSPWGRGVRNDWAPKHYMHILVYCCCWVARSCPTLCDPLGCGMPGLPVLHYLLEFAQTHVHWDGDAIQPSHLLSPPSPPVLNLSHHHVLFQWVGSLHQVAKVLELHLQHQYECIYRNTLFI